MISPGVFILCCVLVGIVMWKKEASPLEWLSVKWDKRFVHSFTYYFREKCEYCGKRGFGECAECGKRICVNHLGTVLSYKCKKCKPK